MTKAVGSVTAGQELWFPNTGLRESNGKIRQDYPQGKRGVYWTSTPSGTTGAHLSFFYDDGPTGNIYHNHKLCGLSVRCVR